MSIYKFLINFLQKNKVKNTSISRAIMTAQEDDKIFASTKGRVFSNGTKPVIRWIKGDGLDDEVTKAAIGQATRLFGNKVDYCVCSQGINAARMRDILEWAVEPVEWWPISELDNPELAHLLGSAGCLPENYGYWWKWFPERVRPNAPEFILDGDMVITGIPTWFEKWLSGEDSCRITQEDFWPKDQMYGRYMDLIDDKSLFYSGLISLPPGVHYMPALKKIMRARPLKSGHNGKKDMCEQGIIAAAFQKLKALPIPLYEFPFGRAFEDYINYGIRGSQNSAWGYHFGHAFVRENHHFKTLTQQGIIFSLPEKQDLIARFKWLGNFGQWGIPGWSMGDECTEIILNYAKQFIGKEVLELGTARGRLSAMLATLGCHLTTLDHHDRGAKQNLEELNVTVILDDALNYLKTTDKKFDLIICDLHGNSAEDWALYSPLLQRCLAKMGMLLIDNATLYKIPEWKDETGVQWFLNNLPPHWSFQVFEEPLPGVAVVRNYHGSESNITKEIAQDISRAY